MKNIFTILVAAIALVAVPAAYAQADYNLSSANANVSNLVLSNAVSATPTAGGAFQLSSRTDKIALQTVLKAANTGTSNVWFTVKFSIDNVNYADTGISVTNSLNGTTAVRTLNTITNTYPAARYVKIVSVGTTQTNNATISASLGQFR